MKQPLSTGDRLRLMKHKNKTIVAHQMIEFLTMGFLDCDILSENMSKKLAEYTRVEFSKDLTVFKKLLDYSLDGNDLIQSYYPFMHYINGIVTIQRQFVGVSTSAEENFLDTVKNAQIHMANLKTELSHSLLKVIKL